MPEEVIKRVEELAKDSEVGLRFAYRNMTDDSEPEIEDQDDDNSEDDMSHDDDEYIEEEEIISDADEDLSDGFVREDDSVESQECNDLITNEAQEWVNEQNDHIDEDERVNENDHVENETHENENEEDEAGVNVDENDNLDANVSDNNVISYSNDDRNNLIEPSGVAETPGENNAFIIGRSQRPRRKKKFAT